MKQGRLLASVRRRGRLLRIRKWLVWGAMAVFAYALLGGPFGVIRYQQLKAREHELVMKQREILAERAELYRQIERLQDDTLYIEKVARERYGYARPGERIHKITPH